MRLYNPLFRRPDPGADGDPLDDLNPDSVEVLAGAMVEPALRGAAGTVQFERQGYFAADADGTPERPVFNRTVTLKDSWAREQARTHPSTAARGALSEVEGQKPETRT